MKRNSLKNLIRNLIEIEPNKSPVLSSFINLSDSRSSQLELFNYECSRISKQLAGKWLEDFELARARIGEYLHYELDADSKGAAVFSRAGANPVFSSIQFGVDLDTQVIVDRIPHIYPLIEIKDSYHRFVIVITTETKAQILETTIGSVTEEILAVRPELRHRVGREWTQEHYRNHKFEKEEQFIKEKIRIVEQLMEKRGHNHLTVAGSPKMVGRVTQALPEHLQSKLVTKLTANPRQGLGPLLRNCLLEFSAAEAAESHNKVQELESAILSNGLGVSGFEACQSALLFGYADTLIIDQDFSHWEGREELVRLATENRVPIETVSKSKTLKRLDSVGCLLRYRPDFSFQPLVERSQQASL